VPKLLSPDELETLAAELARPEYAFADLPDEARVEARWQALHTSEPVPNPAPRGLVRAPFTALDLTRAIDPARRGAIKPYLGDIRPDVDRQDARAVVGWAMELQELGDLDQADVDAIIGLVSRAMPDPAWIPTVPGPTPKQRLFGARSWEHPKPEGAEYLTAPVSDMIPRDDVAAAGGP
jgi:hypothetical protein